MNEESEELVEQLFSQLSSQISNDELRHLSSTSSSSSPTNKPPINEPRTRFHPPVTDEQVIEVQKSCVPSTTERSTQYAINIWKEWSSNRKERGVEYPLCLPHLLTLYEIDYWMQKFVLEIRCKNGKEYPPNTVYQICCGIMHHIRKYSPEINFFSQPTFATFKKTLDVEMKRLKANGAGIYIKRAQPFDMQEE